MMTFFWCLLKRREAAHVLVSRLRLLTNSNNLPGFHSQCRGISVSNFISNSHASCRYFSSPRDNQTATSPDKRNLLNVAILGPPNAGKSTLFNRLLDKESNKTYRLKSENKRKRGGGSKRGRRQGSNRNSYYEGGNAIVSTVPGTTRDCREGIGRIGTCYFYMMDTAGVNGERLEGVVAAAGKHRKKKKKKYDNSSSSSAMDDDDVGERRRMVHLMMQQALVAARQADVIFVMFDARQTGVTSDILEICRWLRKEERGGGGGGGGGGGWENNHRANNSNVFLLANKLENEHHWDYEGSSVHDHLVEAARTGFEVLSISAKHGDGMADIANVIEETYLEREQQQQDDDDDATFAQEDSQDEEEDEKPLQLAILGRPNVGKSTLVNALLQRERVLTGPTPGVTRDAISIAWSWEGRPVQLVDTAGMIRLHSNYKGIQPSSTSSSTSRKIPLPLGSVSSSPSSLHKEFVGDDFDGDEKQHDILSLRIQDMAVKDALRAMKMTDVAVLVLDAGARRLQRRELALAKAVLDEGRALVIAANKMDLILEEAQESDSEDDDEKEADSGYTKDDFARDVRNQLESRFPMLRQTPIVPMSSLTGEGVEDLMPVVFRARDRWSRTISTGELNRWLEEVVLIHRQSGTPHETTKIKYMMQTKGRPPTFLLFCSGNKNSLSDSSLRFLTRHFQDSFQMYGMDVRLIAKNSSSSSHRDLRPKKKRGGSGLGGHAARRERKIKLLQTTGSPKKKRRKTRRS